MRTAVINQYRAVLNNGQNKCFIERFSDVPRDKHADPPYAIEFSESLLQYTIYMGTPFHIMTKYHTQVFVIKDPS